MTKRKVKYRIWALSTEGRLSWPEGIDYCDTYHSSLDKAEEFLDGWWHEEDSPQRYVILKEYDYYDF